MRPRESVIIIRQMEENAALMLQKAVRAKFRFPLPVVAWSSAPGLFTMDTPGPVGAAERDLSAWAYMRRQGQHIGDFADVDSEPQREVA